MPVLSEEAATQIARTYAHAEVASAAQAYRVRRIDSGHDYYLVVIGGRANVQTEVSVDAETGKVLSAAPLSGSGSTIRIDAATAVARAGLTLNAIASLPQCRPSILCGKCGQATGPSSSTRRGRCGRNCCQEDRAETSRTCSDLRAKLQGSARLLI
jgi:hypothetical protein